MLTQKSKSKDDISYEVKHEQQNLVLDLKEVHQTIISILFGKTKAQAVVSSNWCGLIMLNHSKTSAHQLIERATSW